MAKYTYTYDFAGGNYNGKTSYSQVYDTAVPSSSILVTPVRNGYKFRWYTIVSSSTGDQLGSNAAGGQQIVVASNLTLRAVWDKIYYIKYKLSGGYFDSNYSYQQEKWYGTNINLREAPKRTGYTFLGWRDSDYNGALWAAGQAWGADVNTTLTAEWSRNNSVSNAIITYKLNGGSGSTSATVKIGSSITLQTPTRSGYTFDYWLSNHDNNYNGSNDHFKGGASYSYSNTVTLTAQWKKNTTVSKEIGYNLSTRGAMNGQSSYTTERFYGTSLPVSAKITTDKPYLPGWTFLNWRKTYPSPTGVIYNGGESISMNDDWKLRAQWQWIDQIYKIHFNLQGGTGDFETLVYVDTEENHEVTEVPGDAWHHTFTIPLKEPTRDNYKFLGWCVNRADGDPQYQAGETITIKGVSGSENTLYAIWEKIATVYDYSISYNANGGSGAPSKTIVGSSVDTQIQGTISMKEPTRAGYSFLGWSKQSGAATASYQPGEEITLYSTNPEIVLYAVWRTNTSFNYRIDYNTNGGTSVPSTTLSSTDTKVTLMVTYTEPTKSGFIFNGWATEQGSQRVTYYGGEPVTLNSGSPVLTLYAVWEEQVQETTFYLYYSANGGSGAPPTQTGKTTGGSYAFRISSNTPSRVGFTFLGWSKDQYASYAVYSPGDSIRVYGDTTLFAVWSENVVITYDYYLQYNANGGSGAPAQEEYHTEVYEETHYFTISRVTPVRSGFRFVGWAILSTAEATLFPGERVGVSVNSTRSLYAVWEVEVTEKNTHTLQFDANGGSGAPSNITVTNESDHATMIIPSTQPSRKDYRFDGWGNSSTDQTASYHAGQSIDVYTSKTLFAIWTYIPPTIYDYTLKYNANGGTPTPSVQSYSGIESSYSFQITTTTLTKEGFTFMGWSTSSTASSATYSPGSYITCYPGITTLYAVWSEKPTYDFELNYNTNGSTDVIQKEFINDSYNSTETFMVTATEPKREGYSFLGWNTNPSASEALYTAGEEITCYPGITTLYAIWKVNQYNLIYNANGGEGAPQNEKRNYGSNEKLSTVIPTNLGYEFVGWGTNENGPAIYFSGSSFYMGASDVTLYAIWSVASYTLTYELNGGTIPDAVVYKYTYNQVVTILTTNPTRNGYSFAGWGDNPDHPTTIYFASDSFNMPSKDVTLYAIWEYSYTVVFNPNGGTGGPSALTHASSEPSHTFELPDDNPIRDFHVCVGWSKDPNALTPTYTKDSAIPITWSEENLGRLELYAVWERSFCLLVKRNGKWERLVFYTDGEVVN